MAFLRSFYLLTYLLVISLSWHTTIASTLSRRPAPLSRGTWPTTSGASRDPSSAAYSPSCGPPHHTSHITPPRPVRLPPQHTPSPSVRGSALSQCEWLA